uniref:Uncharacterized protein n=1 Tax=Anguilla anguilla TaxID=7936 RepID=A0A0E9U462_ANGAN
MSLPQFKAQLAAVPPVPCEFCSGTLANGLHALCVTSALLLWTDMSLPQFKAQLAVT